MSGRVEGILQKLLLSALTCFVLLGHQHVSAYAPMSKESIIADMLLTDILTRMDKDMDQSNNYFDIDADMPKSLDLVPRSSVGNIPADFDYRAMFSGSPSNPSLRDQEFLQHSSLWGHQYMSGGMGEVPNRFAPIVKTDAGLPAYCNPPNPCPFGYEEVQGCIPDMNFENTAIYSREFQAAQECTCDNEHMFDCAGQDSSVGNTNEMTSTMEKFLMHQFQNENDIDSGNGNGVVKKFYGFAPLPRPHNPYLEGDKLPIAAKKGDHIHG